jgi:phage-related protein
MGWKIKYYCEKLAHEILRLPPGLLARYIHVTDNIQEYGPDLGMPHTRSLGKKLFEIRLKSVEGISRVFYCTQHGQSIMLLHMFIKKSQKTPDKELTIARKRLKEVQNYGT